MTTTYGKKHGWNLPQLRKFSMNVNLLWLIIAGLLLTQCQQRPAFNFTPRIGDNPPQPQVDANQMKFQITTKVTNQNNQAIPRFALVQKLVITAEYFRQDQLIVKITEQRHEAEFTNGNGDWIDNHEANSAMMGVLDADSMHYDVKGELLSISSNQPLPVNMFVRDFNVQFGPSATPVQQQMIRSGMPANVNSGFQYTQLLQAVVYTYHYDVEVFLSEDPQSGAMIPGKRGNWGIAFWTPLSAFGLNQTIDF